MEESTKLLGVKGGAHDDNLKRIHFVCIGFAFRIRRGVSLFLNGFEVGK